MDNEESILGQLITCLKEIDELNRRAMGLQHSLAMLASERSTRAMIESDMAGDSMKESVDAKK